MTKPTPSEIERINSNLNKYFFYYKYGYTGGVFGFVHPEFNNGIKGFLEMREREKNTNVMYYSAFVDDIDETLYQDVLALKTTTGIEFNVNEIYSFVHHFGRKALQLMQTTKDVASKYSEDSKLAKDIKALAQLLLQLYNYKEDLNSDISKKIKEIKFVTDLAPFSIESSTMTSSVISGLEKELFEWHFLPNEDEALAVDIYNDTQKTLEGRKKILSNIISGTTMPIKPAGKYQQFLQLDTYALYCYLNNESSLKSVEDTPTKEQKEFILYLYQLADIHREVKVSNNSLKNDKTKMPELVSVNALLENETREFKDQLRVWVSRGKPLYVKELELFQRFSS